MLHKDDVDLTYFVTAHELGHQWWGHQLIGGAGAGLQHDVGDAGTVLRLHGRAA